MKFKERILKRLEIENIFNKEKFLELISNNSKYVIGRNQESIEILKKYNISGIIDDFSDLKNWNKFPIFKSNEIEKSSLIINCSTSIAPNTVIQNLINNGFTNILNYSDFINFNPKLFSPSFSQEMLSVLDQKYDYFDFIFEKLSDQISRKIFEDLILFRITCNPTFTKEYSINIESQYLEMFMNYQNEIFVDVGGFDGDTSELFLKKESLINKIFFIEPSNFNLNNAKTRLNKNLNIQYFNCGLSDKKETLNFNECNNTASSFSAEGDIQIEVNKLDDLINEEVTFIKMDIEGFELKALKGAEELIREYNPKLAIAVYHKSSHFFDIPNFILNINPNYKLYLRHYTQGWSETIMYFTN